MAVGAILYFGHLQGQMPEYILDMAVGAILYFGHVQGQVPNYILDMAVCARLYLGHLQGQVPDYSLAICRARCQTTFWPSAGPGARLHFGHGSWCKTLN